eukprot:jgi/Mesvir1/1844/Mv06945-RA.2
MEDGLSSHRGPLTPADAPAVITDTGGGSRPGGPESAPVAAVGPGGLTDPTADDRVDCCLYFLHPAGNRAKRIDVEVMRRLQQYTAVIPCLAKVDAMTEDERAACCAAIRDQLTSEGIAPVPLKLDEGESGSVRAGAGASSGGTSAALLASRKALERLGGSAAEAGGGEGRGGPGGQPVQPLCIASSCVVRGGEPVRVYEWGICRLASVSDMAALIQNFSDISVVLSLKRNTEAVSSSLTSSGRPVTSGSADASDPLRSRSMAVSGDKAGDPGYGEGAGGPWAANPGLSDKLVPGSALKPSRLRLGKVGSWLKLLALYVLLVSCLRAPVTTHFLSAAIPAKLWRLAGVRGAPALSQANKGPSVEAPNDARDGEAASAGHVDSEHRGFLRLLDRFDAEAPVDVISDSGRPILFGIGREMAPVRLPLCAPYVVKVPTRHGALFRPSDSGRGGMDMISIDPKRPRGGAALPDFYFSYAASDAVCLKQVCTDEFILAFPCVWPAKQQRVRVTVWRAHEARPHLLEVHRKNLILPAGEASAPLANAFHVSEGNFLEMNQETEFLSLQLHIYALTGTIKIQDEARAGVYNSEAEVVMESAQSLYVSAWAPLLNAILKTLEYRRGPEGPPAFSLDEEDKARGGAGGSNQDRINAVLTLFRAGAAPLVEKVSLPVELQESAAASRCSADGSVFENGDIGLSEAEILVRCLDSTGQPFAGSNDRVEAVLRAMGVTQRIMLSPGEQRVPGSSNAPVFRARLLRPNVPFDLMIMVNGEALAQGPSHMTVEKAMLCEGPLSDQGGEPVPQARDPAMYNAMATAGGGSGGDAAGTGQLLSADAAADGARADAGRGAQPGGNLAGWFMKRLGYGDASGGGGGAPNAGAGVDSSSTSGGGADGLQQYGANGLPRGQMSENGVAEDMDGGPEVPVVAAHGATPSIRRAGGSFATGGRGTGGGGHGASGKGGGAKGHGGAGHTRGGAGARSKGAGGGAGPRGHAVPSVRMAGLGRGSLPGVKGLEPAWAAGSTQDVPAVDGAVGSEFDEGGDDSQGGGDDGADGEDVGGLAEGQEAGDVVDAGEEGADEGTDDGGANGGGDLGEENNGAVEGVVPAQVSIVKKEEPNAMDPQALFRSLVKPGKNKVMQIAKAAANRGSKKARGSGAGGEGSQSNEFVEMSDISEADLVQAGTGQEGGVGDGEELLAEGSTGTVYEDR